MNKKAIVPISGGQDSTVVLHSAVKRDRYDVYPISFDYKQRHAKELVYAKWQVVELGLGSRHRVIDISFFNQIATISALTNNNIDVPNVKDILGHPQPPTYVPFRNLMLLSICCAYAESIGAEVVMFGSAQVDSLAGYWDSSPEFQSSINNLVKLNRKTRIDIQFPLINMSKKDILLRGTELGVRWEETWTCYAGGEKACGKCAACSSRLKGFKELGIKDSLEYADL